MIAQINKSFRILALSATPGSDEKKLQEVVNNLLIATIEARAEDDEELLPYTHEKLVEHIICNNKISGTGGKASNNATFQVIRQALLDLMTPAMNMLTEYLIIACDNTANLNPLIIREAHT